MGHAAVSLVAAPTIRNPVHLRPASLQLHPPPPGSPADAPWPLSATIDADAPCWVETLWFPREGSGAGADPDGGDGQLIPWPAGVPAPLPLGHAAPAPGVPAPPPLPPPGPGLGLGPGLRQAWRSAPGQGLPLRSLACPTHPAPSLRPPGANPSRHPCPDCPGGVVPAATAPRGGPDGRFPLAIRVVAVDPNPPTPGVPDARPPGASDDDLVALLADLPPGAPLPPWSIAQVTLCRVVPPPEAAPDPARAWTVAPFRPVLLRSGAAYLLQDIYGLGGGEEGQEEIGGGGGGGGGGGDGGGSGGEDDGGEAGECVVCLSEPRDVALLPCRHLCLCPGCARQLLRGAGQGRGGKCPICRRRVRTYLAVGD